MNDAAAKSDPKVIDGKAFAESLRRRIAQQVATLRAGHGFAPGLAVVLVGENPASQVYVRNKGQQTKESGMASFEHKLPAETSQKDLLALVDRLNKDPAVSGILVQLPLPKQIDPQAVINAMLKDRLGDLAGRRAIVVGRSNIVGKPMAQLLLGESCTVTIVHSKSRDLAGECRRAEIVIAAVGRPEMVRGDWIAPGATVIDVGINRIDAPGGKTKLVGDVAYAEAYAHAGAITPVPGGVGPMTIACLLQNTLTAACRQRGISLP